MGSYDFSFFTSRFSLHFTSVFLFIFVSNLSEIQPQIKKTKPDDQKQYELLKANKAVQEKSEHKRETLFFKIKGYDSDSFKKINCHQDDQAV